MSTLKRWDGTAYQTLTTLKRWDGTAWVDLTTAARWDGTSWVTITLGGGGGGALTATVNPSYLSANVYLLEPAPSTTAVTSPTATVTAAGGTGPYTYAWTKVSGASGVLCNSLTAAATNFTANVHKWGDQSATWRCTITDSVLATVVVNVDIYLSYTTDGSAP